MRKFSWLFLLLILVVFADGKEKVFQGKDSMFITLAASLIWMDMVT